MNFSSIRSNGLIRFTEEVLHDSSFFAALGKAGLQDLIAEEEQKYEEYEESKFDIHAEELQTFLTRCSQARDLEPGQMLQFLKKHGFSFESECLQGNSSDEIIRNIISKCKSAALDYQKASLDQVADYANSHDLADKNRFRELYNEERLFASILFDDKKQIDVTYELLGVFNTPTFEKKWIAAMRDFALNVPDMVISNVFRVQYPELIEERPEEFSDEGEDEGDPEEV